MATVDAYTWTQEGGLQKGGLKCEGVISPTTSRHAPQNSVYDVVVIGAGYAGLSAARNLVNMSLSRLDLSAQCQMFGPR